MQVKVRQILRDFKAEIVDSLSEGNVHGLLDELSGILVPEDRQRIQCAAAQRGHSWAADTLLDCLKFADDAGFTKFLKYLQENRSTEGLYKKISDECVEQDLEYLIPRDNAADDNGVKIYRNSDEAAKALIADSIPDIVNGLSEGECGDMLRHFQRYLSDPDTQKIKCVLKEHGKNRAISQMINSLLPNGKATLMHFIEYFSKNKKNLFDYIEIKLSKYGLKELLPIMEQYKEAVQETGKEDTEVDLNHKPSGNIEELPIPESSGNMISDAADDKKVD